MNERVFARFRQPHFLIGRLLLCVDYQCTYLGVKHLIMKTQQVSKTTWADMAKYFLYLLVYLMFFLFFAGVMMTYLVPWLPAPAA